MPASALINNGWSLEGSTEVASMNSAETRFTRDGKQFTAELVNYGEYPTTMEDCVVCGIYFDFSGGAAADAVLSGGISLKNASASVMAGNLTDISNKASKFMSYGGGMLYAFGNPTDYDGQIEIMANGAYLYRRYNGIRSMSGFDRIAKYFVY
jgi:hypothetical protein